MKKSLLLTAIACVSALPVLAQDKELHVYNWSDYIAEDTVSKFEAETGINVTYDIYDSNEVLEAKLLAGGSGYDVVVPSSNFLQRQVAAGVYQELDKSKLPNLKNMDPDLMKAAAAYDPDNAHAIIYMWGTLGLGYNTEKIKERLGADAPTDSWALLFDPANAEKLKDCGITLLDAPSDVFQLALVYLGLDPQSTKPDDLQEAADLLNSIRPYIRYFHSSQYITDLANGEVCLSVGYSGDVFIAASRAEDAENGVEVAYSVPKEGTQQWFDMMAIPADAPNPDAAYAWMNFIMEPQITADITNYVWYANANTASLPLVNEEIRSDPAIFPPKEVLDRLFPAKVYDAKTDRLVTRLWTRVRTGQ